MSKPNERKERFHIFLDPDDVEFIDTYICPQGVGRSRVIRTMIKNQIKIIRATMERKAQAVSVGEVDIGETA